MVRIAAFALLGLLGFSSLPAAPPQSASFDCSKASHPLEKSICASPRLSALDGEVAALFRAKLALVFDKTSFRGQQRDWQQILRTRCAKGCNPAAVERDYVQQRDMLRALDGETWEASYKTADVATLTITHLSATQFDFSLVRDLEGAELCKFPANDGEAGAVATISSPAKASWSGGSCRIDFLLSRDKAGAVTRIDTNAAPGCKRYCKSNHGLSDVVLPANNWAAGNQ